MFHAKVPNERLALFNHVGLAHLRLADGAFQAHDDMVLGVRMGRIKPRLGWMKMLEEELSIGTPPISTLVVNPGFGPCGIKQLCNGFAVHTRKCTPSFWRGVQGRLRQHLPTRAGGNIQFPMGRRTVARAPSHSCRFTSCTSPPWARAIC